MIFPAEKKPSLARAVFSCALHTYFLMRRGLTIGVRAIVRSDDGKFLLARHTYTPGWHFPGGGVEKGETIEQALSNELLQETGLRLADKPVFHGVFLNNGVSKRDHVLRTFVSQKAATMPSRRASKSLKSDILISKTYRQIPILEQFAAFVKLYAEMLKLKAGNQFGQNTVRSFNDGFPL